MLTSKLGTCAVLTSVVLVTAACSHDNGRPNSYATASNAQPPTPASIDTAAPSEPGVTNQQKAGTNTGLDSTAGSTMNADPSAEDVAVDVEPRTALSDDDIVAIMKAIHTSQIQEAQVARARGQSSAVKTFANLMMAENTSALQREQAMATQSQLLANTSNRTCQVLTTYVRQEVDTLQSMRGRDFDSAYMDEVVHGYEQGLSLITDTLIPSARNAELKVQLQSLKTRTERELLKAENTQKKLSARGSQRQSGQN